MTKSELERVAEDLKQHVEKTTPQLREIAARNRGFETVEIARKDAPDVRFKGRLLGRVDSDTDGDARADRAQGKRDRWTRLELWELKSGTWVAASIGCSDRKGEVDIGTIEVVRTHETIEGDINTDDERVEVGEDRRRLEVLHFFGWTWLAKKLAEQLGWDVAEVIE